MGECPVCYTNDATRRLICTHSFCDSCVKEWYLKNPTCPMCRRSLYFKGMRHVAKYWEKPTHWESSIEYLFDNYFIDVNYLKHIQKKFYDLNDFYELEEDEFIEILLDDDIEIIIDIPKILCYWECPTWVSYIFLKKKPVKSKRVHARSRSNWLLEN